MKKTIWLIGLCAVIYGSLFAQNTVFPRLNVGDLGPAGGLIFYDKGEFSNGWRYLEAAPAGTEFKAEWGGYDKYITGIKDGVGFGKQNTQRIVEGLKSSGESERAAQVCASLSFGGYTDWFLPSKEEL